MKQSRAVAVMLQVTVPAYQALKKGSNTTCLSPTKAKLGEALLFLTLFLSPLLNTWEPFLLPWFAPYGNYGPSAFQVWCCSDLVDTGRLCLHPPTPTEASFKVASFPGLTHPRKKGLVSTVCARVIIYAKTDGEVHNYDVPYSHA